MRHPIARRALLAAALPAPALAQGRAARVLVGFAPGGPSDVIARLLAEGLRGAGHAPSVIVENRTGAGGRLAVEQTVAAPPDGATMVVTPASLVTVFPAVYGRALRYDANADLTPVTPLCAYSFALAVPAAHPARDLAGLAAWARERGGLSCGNPAAGSMPHFLAVRMGLALGVPVTHVPYRGSAPALTDLVAGRVTYLIDALPPALPFIRDGRLRALGVGTRQRARLAPDLAPIAEQGLPEFESYTWAALYATGGSPAAAVTRLSEEVRRAATAPDVAARFAELGYEGPPTGPAELAAIQREEARKWGEVIRRAGIRPET